MNKALTPEEIEAIVNKPQCECPEPFAFWEGCPVHGWTEYFGDDEEERG